MFPTLLDTKNAKKAQKKFIQNNTKNRMTHFHISVTVKCRRDKNNQRTWTSA